MRTISMSAKAAMPGSNDRKFWTEFLALYQSQTALWDMSDEIYKDRCAKIKSYDLLKEKLREILPGASREDVLRRINIFRTNYRRERMRALKYRERGSNYQTSLWYFQLLSFLEPQIIVKSRTRKTQQQDLIKNEQSFSTQSQNKTECNVYNTNMYTASYPKLENVGDHEVNEIEELEYFFEGDGRIKDPSTHEIIHNNDSPAIGETNIEIQYKFPNNIAEDFEHSSTQTTRLHEYMVTDEDMSIEHDADATETELNYYSTKIQPKSKEQRSMTTASTEATKTIKSKSIPSVCQQTHSEKDFQVSSASEILARSWAVQYDEMTAEQKIYARKEIAEILFAGCMGTLGLKS